MEFPLESPPPRSASECTCARLRRLTRRLTALYDERLAPTGLRVTQFSLLATLQREGGGAGVTLSDLADAMDMDRTTLTRNLRPLTTQRLISIGADAADGRSRRATLTPRGLAALKAARPYWRSAQNFVAASLGERNITALHGWVDSVLPSFRGALPGDDA
jgi:DNA-binding MarR family transcriptional regulator